MKLICLDFESAYTADLGFKTQTTEQYIRDPRFEVIGVGVKVDDRSTQWASGTHEEIAEFLAQFEIENNALIAHNAAFDAAILGWVFNIRPKFIIDTLSMGRALHGAEVGNSLAALSQHYGVGVKGTEVVNAYGKFRKDFTPSELAAYAGYCKNDVELTYAIFKKMAKHFPLPELRLIDMTIKMYTEPKIVLDSELLVKEIEAEAAKRQALLDTLQVTDEDLASADRFAQLLVSLGIDPPKKISKRTGKESYAFAKTDAVFQSLLDSDREEVSTLCHARLAVKSTQARTRAQSFLDIASRGALPVPLSYFGAITGRWTASRGDRLNMQNLKRKSFLRRAMLAPEGHSFVVGDLSQIEPRVIAHLADYGDLLDIFRSGQDVYAQFGAKMFGIPGLTKDSHPELRQSAKSALLGANYNLGWRSFAQQLLTGFLGAPPVLYDRGFAEKIGVTTADFNDFVGWHVNLQQMETIPHTCTREELVTHCVVAKKIIDVYRLTAKPIVALWEMCSDLIERSLYGGEEVAFKCLVFRKEEIVLPSGMCIRYPGLSYTQDARGRKQWFYGKDKTKLYGGSVTNNITQGTAGVVMADGMLRTSKRYFICGTVHDEQITIVPDEEVDQAVPWVRSQMTKEPSYLKGIPLSADVNSGKNYGECK